MRHSPSRPTEARSAALAGRGCDRALRARRALSLIETLVALVIMGGASILYASVWKAQVIQRATVEQIGTAMSLYLRQVELIQSMHSQKPTGTGAYTETNFNGCPPYPYSPARMATNQLDPPLDPAVILTSWNSFLIPATSTWMLPLPANLVAQGYSITVRANRVQTGTSFTREERLVKYNVRVNINDAGTVRNIITGEFFQEVR